MDILGRDKLMDGETKRIRVHIASKSETEKLIPAVAIAELFQRIQNILYYIVDDLEGNVQRKCGDFPNSVKERSELVITQLHIGSVEAELAVSDTQIGLPGRMTLGEKAISIADDIISSISLDDDFAPKIAETISSKHRLNRVLREIELLWPDDRSNYNIGLNFGIGQMIFLDPSRKQAIHNALCKPPEWSEKSIAGRLTEVRVDQRRSFQVDTAEGLVTCSYAPELEDKIVESIGRLVRIRGIMALDKGRYTLSLEDEESIEGLDYLPLDKVRLGGRSVDLKEPLLLEVYYEDDLYLVLNDKFHLRATGPSLKAAIEEINEEIQTLWEDYVETGLEELSLDALDLRRELISAFGGDTVDAHA